MVTIAGLVATLRAEDQLTPVLRSVHETIGGVGERMEAFGQKLTSVGASLSLLSAPLDAIGVGAVKMASDYEDAMSKIRGVTGTSQGQFEAYNAQVVELSKTVPKSAKELADGLFFVVSAGFQGADAMNILKISAEAAAAGLGTTKVVGDAVTSVLNA